MKFHTEPLEPSTCYHIYNRGINGMPLFYEHRNYDYFLEKLCHYITPVADMLAFCLLTNHFHLLIHTHSRKEIEDTLCSPCPNPGLRISRQFSHFFNGYSQGINKVYGKTGGLFETPFRRNPIVDEEQMINAVCYIHTNPDHHRIGSYKTYPYSSFAAYTTGREDLRISKDLVFSAFGVYDSFLKLHAEMAERKNPGGQQVVSR